jgi:AcrR family transcriptional regulator
MARSKKIYDKQKIFEISSRIVNEEGVAALSVRHLAGELKVSSMTLYNYVENINEIKKEIVLDGMNRLYHRVYQALDANQEIVRQKSAAELCMLILREIYLFAEDYQGSFELMFGKDSLEFRQDAEMRPLYGLFWKLLKKTCPCEEMEDDYQKGCVLVECVMCSLILEHLQNKQSYPQEAYEEYLGFLVRKLFG